MSKFKVIDPKGFHFDGKLIEKGGAFSTEGKSAVVTTALHFKQVEEVKAKAEDPDADAKAQAEAEKLAAEAKAKADADAKGKK